MRQRDADRPFWYAITSDGFDFPVGQCSKEATALAIASAKARHIQRGRIIRVYHLAEGTMRRRRRTGRDAYRRPSLYCRVCGKEGFLTSSSLKDHIALNHVKVPLGMSKKAYKKRGKKTRAKAERRSYNRSKYAAKRTKKSSWKTKGKRSYKGWKKPGRKDVREFKKRSGSGLFEQWRTKVDGVAKGYQSSKGSRKKAISRAKKAYYGYEADKPEYFPKDRTMGSGNWSSPASKQITRKDAEALVKKRMRGGRVTRSLIASNTKNSRTIDVYVEKHGSGYVYRVDSNGSVRGPTPMY